MTRAEFLDRLRRDRTDELIGAAIDRARQNNDHDLEASLQRDRLSNALEGFRMNRRR